MLICWWTEGGRRYAMLGVKNNWGIRMHLYIDSTDEYELLLMVFLHYHDVTIFSSTSSLMPIGNILLTKFRLADILS